MTIVPSTSPPDETPTLPRIFLARCDRYDNLHLILSKLRRSWGRFAL